MYCRGWIVPSQNHAQPVICSSVTVTACETTIRNWWVLRPAGYLTAWLDGGDVVDTSGIHHPERSPYHHLTVIPSGRALQSGTGHKTTTESSPR